MSKRVLVNGEAIDHVSIFDRGLQYGDGLFETMLVRNGRIPLWSYHWQRLHQDCARLNIPSPDQTELISEIDSFVAGVEQAVLKLIITRGKSERGYAVPVSCQPTRILIMTDRPDYPSEHRNQGVRLYACETRLGINPALAGIKHLNRLEQVMARSEWQDQGYQEGLLLDINNNVIEGSMSNVFWIKGHCLFTPGLSGSGVAGVMREIVMQLAKDTGISIKMGLWSTSELLDAEEIFITNSLIGIWPVSYILNKTFAVGPVTLQLQSMLQAKYAI